MPTPSTLDPVRWMIIQDLPEVLEIEAKSFRDSWTKRDFAAVLRQPNCIGMVYESKDSIYGFMIYQLFKQSLHLLNFAVHPDCRRRGVGLAMIDRLIGKLSHERRCEIVLETRERNLPSQLFFKRCGFRATQILPDFYEGEPDEAGAIEMVYRLTPLGETGIYAGANRITPGRA